MDTSTHAPVQDGSAHQPDDMPSNFLKGVAISMWQNSGGRNTNWADFAESTGKCCGLIPNIMDRDTNVVTSDFWNKYEEDILNAKALGCTAFRLSLEWHRIEPKQGVIDQSAIQRYHEIFDFLEKQQMVPSVTLHHFVHPSWWHKMGAFEKRENLHHFVKFCEVAAVNFGKRVKMWCTFNEPTTYIVCGYLIGVHPPGRILNVWLVGTVLTNMLHAHTLAYRAMKAVPGAEHTQIGIVHHHVEFMTHKRWQVWARPLAWWSAYWWGRDVVLNYFMTGEIDWMVPCWGTSLKFSEEGGRPPCDWWGLNYYTRGVIGGACMPVAMPGEEMTDMQYPVHPTGLYEHIARTSQLGLPMYVTETGAADKSPDEKARLACVETYFDQCMKAVRDGFDVRGFFYWTLVDNFEWNCGHLMKFGLYAWSPGDPERKLRQGGRLLARLYGNIPDELSELRDYLKKNYILPEYEANLKHEQLLEHPQPVCYHKGRFINVEVLSPLFLRIGLHPLSGKEGQDITKKLDLSSHDDAAQVVMKYAETAKI